MCSSDLGTQVVQLSRRRMQLNHLSAASAVLVTDVIADGPAYRAGIRARDIILSVGDSVVTGIDDMQRVFTRDCIDRTTRVTLLREGVQLSLTLTPTERSSH